MRTCGKARMRMTYVVQWHQCNVQELGLTCLQAALGDVSDIHMHILWQRSVRPSGKASDFVASSISTALSAPLAGIYGSECCTSLCAPLYAHRELWAGCSADGQTADS